MADIKTFIWNLLLVVLTAALIFFGFRTYTFHDELVDLIAVSNQQKVGTDKDLLETVNNLEKSLAEQAEFQFTLRKDPLDLTRVLTKLRIFENPEYYAKKRERKPRLSATLMGPEPQAIIRMQGKDWVVRQGDSFADGQFSIAQIGEGEVILRRRIGTSIVLPIEKIRSENRN